jgi:hypothetical protein
MRDSVSLKNLGEAAERRLAAGKTHLATPVCGYAPSGLTQPTDVVT